MPAPSHPVLISKILARNFLSFGPKNEGIELKSLNVLVGPNGSGKSNLIETINFMRAAPRDFTEITRKGGGAGEWIWKGLDENSKINRNNRASLMFELVDTFNNVSHSISFNAANHHFYLAEERIIETHDNEEPEIFFIKEKSVIKIKSISGLVKVKNENYESNLSVLAQFRDPNNYSFLLSVTYLYQGIRIYREWSFGRNTIFREPQKSDMRNDTLLEDFSNLGLFLSRLQTRFPSAKKAILKALKDLYDGIDDYNVHIEGGTVQVFFTEGDFSIPATRLSDGTLRYLCLLAILCDPQPPPLICIEEPELGLHPDIIPKLADLLKDASTRTQLIVTTHSDILVDAMTETPEAVVICEKHNGQTEMKRLNADDLKEWLKEYRLGQLWIKGQLGGTRW